MRSERSPGSPELVTLAAPGAYEQPSPIGPDAVEPPLRLASRENRALVSVFVHCQAIL